MAAEPAWMQIARDELGVSEIGGPENNRRVLEYHATTTYKATSDDVPWCSSFMCWLMEKAGVPSTKNAGSRSWLEWGVPLGAPIPGCVVVFANPGTWTGHVALYVEPSSKPGYIRVLGGNQGNKVCIADYPKGNIAGFRWPKNVPVPVEQPKAESAPPLILKPGFILVSKAALEQLIADYAGLNAQMQAALDHARAIMKGAA